MQSNFSIYIWAKSQPIMAKRLYKCNFFPYLLGNCSTIDEKGPSWLNLKHSVEVIRRLDMRQRFNLGCFLIKFMKSGGYRSNPHGIFVWFWRVASVIPSTMCVPDKTIGIGNWIRTHFDGLDLIVMFDAELNVMPDLILVWIDQFNSLWSWMLNKTYGFIFGSRIHVQFERRYI